MATFGRLLAFILTARSRAGLWAGLRETSNHAGITKSYGDLWSPICFLLTARSRAGLWAGLRETSNHAGIPISPEFRFTDYPQFFNPFRLNLFLCRL